MPTKLTYAQYDVFTSTRFLGNPLAIVHVPSSAILTQEQKQLIAREFNLSETTFVHDNDDGSGSSFRIDIFTPHEELPFAGHPTVGTGCHLLSTIQPSRNDVTLNIKAGPTPVHRLSEPDRGVKLQIPVDFKIHPSFLHPDLKRLQSALTPTDYVHGDGAEPIVSIVKKMNFFLVELTSVDALGRASTYPSNIPVPTSHLGDWARVPGELENMFVYTFVQTDEGKVRARMFGWPGFEDPATGSAACTLGGYLASKKGKGNWKFEMTQGVEMGRKSEISIFVEINDNGEVEKVELAGEAIKVMEGTLEI
ncbi:phenazine biosynthesis-like [Moniliophthora roreri MCA 2997]|uniref:Phenazine biosynthesis-like n=1 Tax=Moniliophthora roreri (strain MCA 2997) TaxID=1381753 RepID=V2XKL3_MONRO|nr:phenazine biosynthesis-like [Moniliophthora roreri MCA 2997]